MPSLRLRWSEHEARKPYARPFGVSFLDETGEVLGSMAVNGADLLYWRQFEVAVARLCGELFILDSVCTAPDQQRAWLDVLAPLLPAAPGLRLTPRSAFDQERGRVFTFAVEGADPAAAVGAETLLEYQEFQASVAHQTGTLLRVAAVEACAEAGPRQAAWLAWLRSCVDRPAEDEAMSARWPWR